MAATLVQVTNQCAMCNVQNFDPLRHSDERIPRYNENIAYTQGGVLFIIYVFACVDVHGERGRECSWVRQVIRRVSLLHMLLPMRKYFN